jgi:hypothetical protein
MGALRAERRFNQAAFRLRIAPVLAPLDHVNPDKTRRQNRGGLRRSVRGVGGDAIGVRAGIGGFFSVLSIIQGGCLSYAFACGVIWGCFPIPLGKADSPQVGVSLFRGMSGYVTGFPPRDVISPEFNTPSWETLCSCN